MNPRIAAAQIMRNWAYALAAGTAGLAVTGMLWSSLRVEQERALQDRLDNAAGLAAAEIEGRSESLARFLALFAADDSTDRAAWSARAREFLTTVPAGISLGEG